MADKQSILIVEDDLDLAEMRNAYFRVQGYDVLTAAWGEDAVRISQENTPHIVLLDIRLPDIDGYEVCRRIRSQRRTESLPIIFLTERRDRIDKLQGLELGVVDCITKPFDIQELRLRVRNALRRASLESLVNPVTGLPEGKLVDEQLDKLLRSNKEIGGDEDFVGHLSAEDFIIVTSGARAKEISERVNSRLSQSMDYFYPLKDRQAETNGRARLSLTLKTLNAASGPYADIGAIKSAVIRTRGQ